MAQSDARAQIRLDSDVEQVVTDEVFRIREQEHMEVSATQAVNRMIREWRKTKDTQPRKVRT